MKVYCKTRKSHRWNEDRFITGKDYFVVIDGATPLKKSNLFNEARWMVDYIKSNFNKCRGSVKSRLKKLCEEAFEKIPVKASGEDYLPSASACWVELKENSAVISLLGDCEVTAVYRDGTVVRFHDDRLDGLDAKAIDEMVAVAKEKNISVKEARKYIEDTLIKHRRLANKPDGYSALLLSENVKIDEKRYEIERENIRTLYLYSDGFAQAFTALDIYPDHNAMFKRICDIGEEIDKIEKCAYADADCNAHPRFKTIDDITAIKVDFE